MAENAYKSTHTGAEVDNAVDSVQSATSGGGTLVSTNDVYSKAEVDTIKGNLETAIGQKANSSDVYAKSNTYSKEETNNLLAGKQDTLQAGTGITLTRQLDNTVLIQGQQITLVTVLPSDTKPNLQDADINTIYLTPRASATTDFAYDKWIVVVNNNVRAWEQVNAIDIDLSPYALSADVESALALKQDKLTAGNNITIAEDGTISATGDVAIEGTTTENHIITAGDEAGEIKDSGVDVESIKTIKMGITSDAYLRFEDIPGLKVGDKLKVHVAGTNSNCHIKAVAYPGKNICNIAAINFENLLSNLYGVRDSYVLLQSGAYYYSPSNTGSGFVYGTSLSNISSTAKKVNLQAEHKYLIMADFTCVERTDDQQKAFAPSLFGLYNNTAGISGTATPTADSGNTTTAKKFYAFVKPTWSVAQDINTKIMNSDIIANGLAVCQDGNSTATMSYTYTEDTEVVDAASFATETTAHGMLFAFDSDSGLYKKAASYTAGTTYFYRTVGSEGDKMNSFVVIDITEAADDAYSLNTTTLIITEANVYARYKASYDTLAAGNSVTSGKALGPYGAGARQYIRAYYRKLYCKVPSGYRLYIRCYRGVTSDRKPSGYLKTICISATNSAIVLDQAVTLNAACLEYLFCTTSNTVVADPSNLEVMVMYYETGKENTAFTAYQLPINVKTGGNMPYGEGFDNTTCVLYGSGTGEAEYTVSVSSSNDYITGSLSIIAENSSYGATFAQTVTDTASDKTYVEFVVDSVNDAIVAIRNQIVKINQSPVLNTLPTAKGTYKYEVATEGVPGTWTKEEETVNFFKVLEQEFKNVDGVVYTARTPENIRLKEFLIYIHLEGHETKRYGGYDSFQSLNAAMPYSIDDYISNNIATTVIIHGIVNAVGVPITILSARASMFGADT